MEVSMCLEELYWQRYDDLLKKIVTQLVPADGTKLMKQKTVACQYVPRQYDGRPIKTVSQKALNR